MNYLYETGAYVLLSNLIIGVVSGILSGMIVYCVTKHREEKRQTYFFLNDYLFRLMDNLKIDFPSELIRYSNRVGDGNSNWGKAINNIIDLTRKHELSDREFNDYENELAENILIAINELGKWATSNHLAPKKKKTIDIET